ncbi:T9SS type A sorting domain-containing protein [candidate division KSB1 bacterium]|nr:T9SS type A sorting domain-containing protein [candidate division KSB1 bacterium]
MKKLVLIVSIMLIAGVLWAQITPIKDIQNTTLPSGDSPLNGQVVTISGIITAETYAFGSKYYFIQDANEPWSGVKVYDSKNFAAQGDKVTLTGTVSEYKGCTQVQNITNFTIDSTGITRIVPAQVTTGEIATGGTMAEAYEGCLVQVQNLTITDPDLGYGEWMVDDGSGGCRVDDAAKYYFNQKNYATVKSITGVLEYAFNDTKILPRLANDIIEDSPYTRIQRIQQVRYSDLLKAPLDTRSDMSYMLNDTVAVRGIVTMPTGLSYAGPGIKFIFAEPEGGPWSAILSYNQDSTAYPALFEGDEIEMTGYIFEFTRTPSNMTEMFITSPINILNAGLSLPKTDSVSTGDLRMPTTAEQWGNVFVKVGKATVKDNNLQYELFSVDDGTGSVLVDDDSDSLYSKYTEPPPGVDPLPLPPVGTVAESIRGWVYHHYGYYADSTTYKLEPLYLSDIVWGTSPPVIKNTMRDPAIVKSGEPVTVSTTVETNFTLTTVKLFYKVDQGAYNELEMTSSSPNYQAVIPAQANGHFVSYYIEAVDEQGQKATDPPDVNNANYCYPVKDDDLTIADIQYTPWAGGDSPFQGYKVAVTGVVTVDTTFADPAKYGAYAIQDADGMWNGIYIFGAMPALSRGDEVKVFGKVEDHNAAYLYKWEGNTQIIADSIKILSSGKPLPAIATVKTGDLKNMTASAESYEGVLVRVENFTLTRVNSFDVSIDDGSGECLLDADGFVGRDQDANPYFHVNRDGAFWILAGDTIRVGMQVSYAQGVFLFSFGTHKIEIRDLQDIGTITGVENAVVAPPLQFALEQNYPNPFNPETRIYFQLPRAQEIKLIIYNMRGQQVRTLVDERRHAGQHVVNWDGRNNSGQRVPSGLYIYRIVTDGFIAHKKMLLVK